MLIKANSRFKQKLSALDTFAVVKKNSELELAWKAPPPAVDLFHLR